MQVPSIRIHRKKRLDSIGLSGMFPGSFCVAFCGAVGIGVGGIGVGPS